jgi:3-isopropylmalate dehydrogenase
MRGRHYTLACLAGCGAGPDLMAEASRALAAAARPHGLSLDEVHAPFGSAAFVRMGHPLPPSTRRAYRDADAILVAGTDPAVAGVEADLDLRAGIARVLVPGGVDLCIVSPLGEGADGEWAVERAFELACTRRGRLTAVGGDQSWRELVTRVAESCPGLYVEQLTRPGLLAQVAAQAERFDVVVGDRALADVLVHLAAFGRPGRMAAAGRLAASGPGLFFPDHGGDEADAGHGMVDPAPMLLAAALALGEGLGERASARTLERALASARRGGRNGVTASSRELTDFVLAALPSSIANAEFAGEAGA